MLLAGLSPAAAQTDDLLPVISRVEMIYSIVGRYAHVPDRIDFLNRRGDPQGNTNHVIPHLVYEPVVTLYNPYNTDLRVDGLRVRIENPPVGFKFKKNSHYLREEWNNDGPFLGLGRFQAANEANTAVEKSFTLQIGSAWNGIPGQPQYIPPGACARFSAWVKPEWTWGLETSSSRDMAFLDVDPARDLTNKDGRTGNTFGVETNGAIYPWIANDHRAGFQTDHLSVDVGRPSATVYPFEVGHRWGGRGSVAIRRTESLTVEAKVVDTVLDPARPDFRISLLGGKFADPAQDALRTYSFNMEDLVQTGTSGGADPVISRTFSTYTTIQEPSEKSAGGKKPFATFVLLAKSEALRQRKFEAETQFAVGELFEARFEETSTYSPPFNSGPSDSPASGVQVFGVERRATRFASNTLVVDVAVGSRERYPAWVVKGGADPSSGITDDMYQKFYSEPGPQGTGIYKLMVTMPPEGDRYFIQIGH